MSERSMMDFNKFFSKKHYSQKYSFIRQVVKLHAVNPDAINMGSGLPNSQFFPLEDLSFVYKNKVTTLSSAESTAAFQYGPSAGHAPLIEKWKEFQIHWHNPPSSNWDVVFVPGAQYGFYKILDMILDEGDPIMVQTPAFGGTMSAVRVMRPEYFGIPQDADGIIPEEIEKICDSRVKNNRKLPKALYVNPNVANPTGTVLTNDRKHKIYKLAQKYDFLIIEDDPYYFLHFLDEQPSSFLSIDTDGRVIRLDSLSKIVCPGLRLGAVTAHEEIVQKLVMSIQTTVLHASSLSQILVYKLIEEWNKEDTFNDHIKEIQNYYKSQRDIVIKGMEKHLKGLVEWTVPKGGMFMWLKLKNIESAVDMITNKLVPAGVFLIPGDTFLYDDDGSDQYARLCYSSIKEDEVDRGFAVLAKILRQERSSNETTEM